MAGFRKYPKSQKIEISVIFGLPKSRGCSLKMHIRFCPLRMRLSIFSQNFTSLYADDMSQLIVHEVTALRIF